MSEVHVWEFLGEFSEALEAQLRSDEERWGDAWLELTREGQEERIFTRLNEYLEDWRNTSGAMPVPWLKIAGNALIAWIREQHHEIVLDATPDQ
jgi:hypothetical protein